VVRRAAEAEQAGTPALEARKLARLFVTHLHSDHTIGYPDLILTPWVLGRDKPLDVYGPNGIDDMTAHLLEAYKQDIDIRLSGLEPANDRGHRVNVHVVEPGEVYRDSNVSVTAFPVRHGDLPAFGYAFTTPDRRIVISGDTAPVPELVELAKDCDVLIHEVYSATQFAKRPSEWQAYHAHMHTSTRELADIARRVRPGLLVLYHQLFWGATDADLLAEIGESYDGKVVSGKDLDVF